MARTKEEQQEHEQLTAHIQELIKDAETSRTEREELQAQLKKLEGRDGGRRSDQTLPRIDPEAAEKRLEANRRRRPHHYEVVLEGGKRIGSGRRLDPLQGLARGRSRGEFRENDEHGRPVRRQGAVPCKVTVVKIHGNTGERTDVATYERGERVE